jgi:2-oxoglutarate dehydrogenase E2 component (dihydrolipoamide succinyltransferase)
MPVELKVPNVGESIAEVQIGDWLKGPGDRVERDAGVVVIETDKATVELPAPVSGVVTKQLKPKGATAAVGEVIGYMEEAATAVAADAPQPRGPREADQAPRGGGAGPSLRAARGQGEAVQTAQAAAAGRTGAEPRVMPAARRAMAQAGLAADRVEGTGPGGRVLKEDVERAAQARTAPQPQPAQPPRAPQQAAAPQVQVGQAIPAPSRDGGGYREEEVVPMTLLRKRIAERLVHAQQTAALLTTFNEIDMSAVMALRREHQEAFQQRYGIKLGFMSFFVKAAIDALKLVPQVNAEIRADSIVYHNYYDIGVAVGGGRGLVVPVLRNAERLSFAEVELAIADFAKRAQENKLKLDELTGGTFTISNGGIYGSMMSTPIINPPQSGVLGMHAIQERPVARDGQVLVRPVMYVALTYDHRIVDGREAVTFLKRIKDVIENPARMLIEV